MLFSQILERIEREPFASPRLRQFVDELKQGTEPASRAHRRVRTHRLLDRLRTKVSSHDLSKFRALLRFRQRLAAEAWRKRCGAPDASVDRYRRRNRSAALARDLFVRASRRLLSRNLRTRQIRCPDFYGEDLGHPLIRRLKCVREWRAARRERPRVLLVSGSNMSGQKHAAADRRYQRGPGHGGRADSGKSSASRAAGARDAPSQHRFAAGRPLDFLHGDAAHPPGVRTDAREAAPVIIPLRRIARRHEFARPPDRSRGLVRASPRTRRDRHRHHARPGADRDGPIARRRASRNAHFQDFVEDGQMRFDYKLRDGVVAKSNALELMRLAGLDV